MQTHPPTSTTATNPFQNSHSRWQALTNRTPSSHSSFLYGVKSTKIYCRPTCSARLARRANIVYYDTADQARLDGFRACKRCKPDDPTFMGEREDVVTKALALLRSKKDESITKKNLKELAKEVGVTPSYLCRVFKKTMGVTVGVYMKEFEKAGSEVETASLAQLNGKDVSGAVDPESGLLTPTTTVGSPSAPTEDWMQWPMQEGVGIIEESLDLGIDWNEWLLTDQLANFNVPDIEPTPKPLETAVVEDSVTPYTWKRILKTVS